MWIELDDRDLATPVLIDLSPWGFDLVLPPCIIKSIGYTDFVGENLESQITVTLTDGTKYRGPLKNGSSAIGDLHEMSREWERLGGGK